MMPKDKFVTIHGTRIRKSLIRRYEARYSKSVNPHSDDDKAGVTVFLEDGGTLVDWDLTVEELDTLMEEE